MIGRTSRPVDRPVPGPGQESVWDYPRPPRLEPVRARVRVELAGQLVADTTSAYRVLETSHPPTYYLPPDAWVADVLDDAPGSSFCEWKGRARYESVRVDGAVAEGAVWRYPDPSPAFAEIADYRSCYPRLLDCTVNGQPVQPQPGGFYGGWITPDVVGPFKGEPGTEWW